MVQEIRTALGEVRGGALAHTFTWLLVVLAVGILSWENVFGRVLMSLVHSIIRM